VLLDKLLVYEVDGEKGAEKGGSKWVKANWSRRIRSDVIKRIWKIINNTNAMRWQCCQLGR